VAGEARGPAFRDVGFHSVAAHADPSQAETVPQFLQITQMFAGFLSAIICAICGYL
jgi:hypothetical protein